MLKRWMTIFFRTLISCSEWYCKKMLDNTSDATWNVKNTRRKLVLKRAEVYFFNFHIASYVNARLCTCSPIRGRCRHAFVLTCLLAPCYDKTQNRFDVLPSTEKLGWYRHIFRDAKDFNPVKSSYRIINIYVYIYMYWCISNYLLHIKQQIH